MTDITPANPAARTQNVLMRLAALFVILYGAALCISPAARLRSWQVDYRWEVWLGVGAWLLAFGLLNLASLRLLRDHDPYLLPVAGLLSGWGLLSIWRLYPSFGLRQSAWLLLGAGLILVVLRIPHLLSQLRRYKYLWLSAGLLLTALTFIIGTNPSGNDAWNYWLGCCGIYLQPSEPLKLLLVIYLAAYLADLWFTPSSRSIKTVPLGDDQGFAAHPQGIFSRLTGSRAWRLLALFAPTLIMLGLALSLLVAQRDLGTASIFVILYTAMVYLATGQLPILLGGGFALVGAGAAGYLLFAVVRLRVDAWLNPWLDPSGRSYQIVQSLIAIANGGLIGRGPGLGNPGLVPLAHSDFILTAILEENGLLGAIGLVSLLAIFALRGLRAAAQAPNSFQRYLAAGLTIQLVGQAILIIGGNQRLLPLTGVTLPFISYGGSSLVVSFIALGLLVKVSQGAQADRTVSGQVSMRILAGLLGGGIVAAALLSGWWGVIRAANLVDRTDNPRRYLTDDFVRRGTQFDRQNTPLVETVGVPGDYRRQVNYPPLSHVLGYSDPTYGQSGLEGSLDLILSGRQGTPVLDIWLEHLLYGQPPPGLNVRLSLDLELQQQVDDLLGVHTGALVVLNSSTGEILALASHPTYNANTLGIDWDQIIADPNKPLFNRATQGLYPPGASLGPLLLAALNDPEPPLPDDLSSKNEGIQQSCALPVTDHTWEAVLRNGCPGAVTALGEALGPDALRTTLEQLGLYASPAIDLPVAAPSALDLSAAPTLQPVSGIPNISPLQLALAAASLNNHGTRHAPHLVIAVEIPRQGWTPRPPVGDPIRVFQASRADEISQRLADQSGGSAWGVIAQSPNGSDGQVSWFIGGNLPEGSGLPLVVVVLVEENNLLLVQEIGNALLSTGH